MVEANPAQQEYIQASNEIWKTAWVGIHRYAEAPLQPVTPWIPLEPDSTIELSLSTFAEGPGLAGIEIKMRTSEEQDGSTFAKIRHDRVKDAEGKEVEDLEEVKKIVNSTIDTLIEDYVPTSTYCHPSFPSGDKPRAYKWDELPDEYNMKKKIEALRSVTTK